MDTTNEQLKALFPVPKPDFPSVIVRNPTRYPGWTHESTETLLDCMRDNHRRFHIFFGGKVFHNHSTHHLLTLWAMGADARLLDSAYQSHTVFLTPAFRPPVTGDNKEQPSKGIINEANWKEHLGDDKYYQAYVAFFTGLLLEKNKTTQSVFEEYIFSKDANIIPGKGGSKPLMLARFLSGFLHPLIHVGYGTEFNVPGMLVEGLAQTAIETKWAEAFYPDERWAEVTFTKLRSLVISPNQPEDVHVLTVLAHLVDDPALDSANIGIQSEDVNLGPLLYVKAFKVVGERAGEKLEKHADVWMKTVVPDRAVIRRKFEELAWMVTVMYGVGGWAGRAQGKDSNGAFNADFFNMHLVTSSLLLISQLNTLSLPSATLLLRTYFLSALALYVSRGRPPLPIAEFYASTTATPTTPTAEPVPAKDTLIPAGTPNPWLAIAQTTLVHADMHACKTHRALMHFAEEYGGKASGAFAGLKDVAGAEVLDGTLFIRVAGLTADRLGWMREGQERSKYDYSGFYHTKA